MLAKADNQLSRAAHTEHWLSLDKLMACGSKTNLVSAKKFSHEDQGGSKCNNREYTVLEGNAGRKLISNKNEAKPFKNGKQLTLKTATNSRR